MREKQHPTRQLLDLVSADIPILISNASGHMGVANSAALRAMGITADTPDPEGGLIGREPGSREANGYLEETAFTSTGSRAPSRSTRTTPPVTASEGTLMQSSLWATRISTVTFIPAFSSSVRVRLISTL